MAKVKVRVSSNTTVTGPDGVLYRAGDVFDVDDDDTVAQRLTAGVVVDSAPTDPERGTGEEACSAPTLMTTVGGTSLFLT